MVSLGLACLVVFERQWAFMFWMNSLHKVVWVFQVSDRGNPLMQL